MRDFHCEKVLSANSKIANCTLKEIFNCGVVELRFQNIIGKSAATYSASTAPRTLRTHNVKSQNVKWHRAVHVTQQCMKQNGGCCTMVLSYAGSSVLAVPGNAVMAVLFCLSCSG